MCTGLPSSSTAGIWARLSSRRSPASVLPIVTSPGYGAGTSRAASSSRTTASESRSHHRPSRRRRAAAAPGQGLRAAPPPCGRRSVRPAAPACVPSLAGLPGGPWSSVPRPGGAAPPGSAAAASFASAGEVSGAMAIFSPGLRRRRCSVLRRARAPVTAAASSAPAPSTVRSTSGPPAGAGPAARSRGGGGRRRPGAGRRERRGGGRGGGAGAGLRRREAVRKESAPGRAARRDGCSAHGEPTTPVRRVAWCGRLPARLPRRVLTGAPAVRRSRGRRPLAGRGWVPGTVTCCPA